MSGCRFLERLTFASLIAPLATEEFCSSYWEQRPLVVHRDDPKYYGDLFTLHDFDEAVARAPDYVKVNNAVDAGTTRRPPTVGGLEAVLADMRAGGSLILEKLDRRHPKLGLFCRLLGHELGHIWEADLYLTPPHGKSSVPHWDNTDVFILQVYGSKHWRIEIERRIFPIRPNRMGNDELRAFRGDCIDFTVQPGDLIYIPRGFMHIAECGSEASLHISVGLVPVVLEDLLHALVTAAVQRNEQLRASLPLGFMRENDGATISRAMAALREAAQEPNVRTVFDQFRDELVQSAPLDVAGQIEDFFEPSPLAIDDVVRPRRGVVWRMHSADGSIRLNVGERAIVFPALFAEALEFVLNRPRFAVRAIPGDLQDEARLALVERLMVEGLVVRDPNNRDAAPGG